MARHTSVVGTLGHNARLTAMAVGLAALTVVATTVSAPGAKPPPPSAPPSSSTTTTTTPPPLTQPGGSVKWAPAGRQVRGHPLLYVGTSGAASMAWMPPKLLRAAVFPGTIEPGPWPVTAGEVDPADRPYLVAAFNAGFDPPDFKGTITAFGHAFRDPAPGVASFVAFADGGFTVGMWGRDINPSPNVVAIRQNLSMLVDAGAPTPEAGSPGAWGASVAGVATMRSAIGVDIHGGLVWAGGRLSPADLAAALVASGAVRGMQLDINPDWVNFNLYQPGPDGVVHGSPVYGASGPDRYLSPNSRDFIAVLIQGTAIPGGPEKVGLPPINAEVRLP